MLSEKDNFSVSNTYQDDMLNLSSLINFKDILKPIILHPTVKSICEIDSEGSEKSQLTHWLAVLSKIKNFSYCSVNIQLNSIPKFHGQSKLFKENSVNYLSKAEADHDIFLINANRDYYFLKKALRNIFLNDKQQQSICFLYNIFQIDEKFNESARLAPIKPPTYTLNNTIRSDFPVDSSHLVANTHFPHTDIESYRYGADQAIKDFLTQNQSRLDLDFISIPLFDGLGILYSKKIIKEEIKELLTPNKIYSFMACENFFSHIENIRTNLQMELRAVKKSLGDEKQLENQTIKVQHKDFFLKKIFSKNLIDFYFRLTNYKYKINSFSDVLNHAVEKKVIFFDFFETLLPRLSKASKDIKFKTAEYACLKLTQLGFCIDIDKFNKIRKHEEKKLHEFDVASKYNKGLFFSIIQSVIFTITKKKIEKLVNDVIYYEIRNLINTLFIEKETIDTLSSLKKNSNLIIVCTGNFFSEENIRYIASYFNINQYIDLCHIFYPKKSRKFNDKLYQITLKKIQLPAEQVLYVSNKYLSSYFSPKRNKIKYLFYTRNNVQKYKKLNVRACNAYNRKLKVKKNYVTKTISTLTWAEKNLNNFMYLNKTILDTSNVLYPIIAIFAYQVIASLSILNIKKVFFISKDCDFIKDIFDILLDNVSRFKELKNIIQLKVIDLSEISSACLTYQNLENIEIFSNQNILQEESLSLKNILENFGLEFSDFSDKSLQIIKSHLNTVDPQFLTTLIKSTEFGNELNKLINSKKKLLEETLLTAELLTDEKIALIDFLGCNGSVQKNLSYLLTDYKNTKFFGYYFGTNNLNFGRTHFPHDNSTLFPGVIFSNNYQHTVSTFNKIFNHLTKLFGSAQAVYGPRLSINSNLTNTNNSSSNEQQTYNALQIKLKKTIIADTLKILNLFNIANFSSEIAKKHFIKNFLNFICNKKLERIFMSKN